jgi:hypothetical protein
LNRSPILRDRQLRAGVGEELETGCHALEWHIAYGERNRVRTDERLLDRQRFVS